MIILNSSAETSQTIEIDTDTSKGFFPVFIQHNEVFNKVVDTINQAKKPVKIGVIFNTVKQAQSFYMSLKEDNVHADLMLIHSRYLLGDRFLKEEKLLNTVGKNKLVSRNTIIIGTQVLEQSLDIDFDLMFTDLSPMSLIFQRAGRLHRHEREDRPVEHKQPVLYIIENDKRTTGIHYKIYSEYELESSRYWLLKNNSKFCYHNNIPRTLSEISKIDEPVIEQHRVNYYNELDNHERKGRIYRIGSPDFYNLNPFYDWLSVENESENGDLAGYARVRDIQSGPSVFALFLNNFGEISVQGFNKSGKRQLYPIHDLSEGSDKQRSFLLKCLQKSEITLPQTFAHNKYIKSLEENCDQSSRYVFQTYTSLRSDIPIIFDRMNRITIEDKELEYDSNIGLFY